MTDNAELIERQAWNCDEWPGWLHEVVAETNEVADRLDMSAEQAHAYAALTTLRAQSAGVKGDAEAARDAIRELASVKMDLSLEDWCRISNTILSALEPAAPDKGGEGNG